MSYVVFLKNWTHSGNQQNSAELADTNNYFLMSQAFAPIYEIKSIAGGLQYRCYNEGPAVLGSTIGFSLELNPSRYYCLTDDS